MTLDEYIEYAVQRHERSSNSGLNSGSLASNTVRELLTAYAATPEGRQKLAQSLIQPTRLQLTNAENCLLLKSNMPGTITTQAGTLEHLRDQVTFISNFVSAVPQEETATKPFSQLRSLIGALHIFQDIVAQAPAW